MYGYWVLGPLGSARIRAAVEEPKIQVITTMQRCEDVYVYIHV